MTLFHYTCRHSAQKITRYGVLKPNPQPVLLGLPLVWLTDMDVPEPEALGLTSHTLDCDRLEYRYLVDAPNAVRWTEAKRRGLYDVLVRAVGAVQAVEFEAGRSPDRWWISLAAVPAKQDRNYSRFITNSAASARPEDQP